MDPLKYANKIHKGVNATYSHYSNTVQEPKSMTYTWIPSNMQTRFIMVSMQPIAIIPTQFKNQRA